MPERVQRELPFPDFLIVGVPKAGTTALHAALAVHPQLLMSPVKEPKYFMCGGTFGDAVEGPGDAHSRREWVCDQQTYSRLFEGDPSRIRGESTPFYLYDRSAQRQIHKLIPSVKLIAVLRDPIDRAQSNWLHLRAEGLEPEGDFVKACELEEGRRQTGWSPFWHYLGVGRYGEQLRDLLTLFPRDQVHILRYRQLVDSPRDTLDRICRFLGVDGGYVSSLPPVNTRGYIADSMRTRVLGRTIRGAAQLGASLPPQVWRTASVPLVRALQWGAGPRPVVSSEDRRRLLEGFREDVVLLESITGESYQDWLGGKGRGEFRARTGQNREEPVSSLR